MPDHISSEPVPSRTEPAAVAEGARVVLGVLIGLGWFNIPDDTINTITTAIGALASIALTWWTRRRVTPVAKLRPAAET